MRGEYFSSPLGISICRGSPPLARGIQVGGGHHTTGTRITPACAGNTVIFNITAKDPGDHPRLRGEYRLVAAEKAVTQGSPPLARGILLNLRLRRSIRRITPACAGNTISKDFPQCLIQDHPRLRGEYCYLRRWRQGRQGSPPLARGIPNVP